MTSKAGMTAFVPNGDSPRETAIILIAAARDNGLDDAREVVAGDGGFYISDALADALGGEAPDKPSDPSEIQKAVDQIDAEDTPVSGDEAVDASVDITSEPADKQPAKKTSSNRAAKATSKKDVI